MSKDNEPIDRLFRQMFEKTSAIKMIIDPLNGEVFDVNPAAAAFYGYPREAMRGMNISQINILPPERIAIEMRDAVSECRSVFRFRHRLASGELRDVEVHAGRVDLDGRTFLQSIISDVTERNRLEAELRRANSELEAIVAERTRALEEEVENHKRTAVELRRAKDFAELANRAKTEFLASVSHELRTPLNAIIGYSDPYLLDAVDQDRSPSLVQFMANIHESGLHLLDIINDILDISAIEIGRLTLHLSTVETAHLCLAVERLIRPRADRKSLSLFTDISEAPERLVVDERRVKQVLVNLLGNAVKFTPPGGSVHLRIVKEAGGVAMVVRDTGIGMDDAGIRTALTPFGQIDNSLSRQYEGTGIGLPLSAHFTEMHGGKLTIASAPGAGTAVTVTFPDACQ